MKRLIFALLLLVAAPAYAEQWILTSDYQNDGIIEYRVNLNGVDYDTAPKINSADGSTCVWFDVSGKVAFGVNTVTVVAVGMWGESGPSTPFVFTVAEPGLPSGLRIVHIR